MHTRLVVPKANTEYGNFDVVEVFLLRTLRTLAVFYFAPDKVCWYWKLIFAGQKGKSRKPLFAVSLLDVFLFFTSRDSKI